VADATSALEAQLLQRSAELSSVQDELGIALAGLHDARRDALLLARQVAALRAALADSASEAAATAEAAAAREAALEGERSRLVLRAEAAEAGAAAVSGKLEAAERKVQVLQQSSSSVDGSCGGVPPPEGQLVGESTAAGGTTLGLLEAARHVAEELGRALVEREDELAHYKRLCSAMERRLARAKQPSTPVHAGAEGPRAAVPQQQLQLDASKETAAAEGMCWTEQHLGTSAKGLNGDLAAAPIGEAATTSGPAAAAAPGNKVDAAGPADCPLAEPAAPAPPGVMGRFVALCDLVSSPPSSREQADPIPRLKVRGRVNPKTLQ
jgi:hypothetical protein